VLISAQQTQEIIMGSSFKSMADMFDGGGAGRAGQRFEGGAMSDFLNDIGVKPYGYYDRMKAVRPQMRPAGLLGGGSAAAGGMGAPELNNPRIRAALRNQPGMDEAIVGNNPPSQMFDAQSETDQFRRRMQNLGSQLGEIGAVQPMETEQPAAYRPDPAMVAGAYKEHPSAPGYGQAFLSAINQLPPNERDMVMGNENAMYSLFQRFMQTGSIR
jgi:hypothetical protein